MRKFKDIVIRAKKSKLIADSFWSLGGNVIGRGLALAAGILVARFLNAEIFGEYTIVRNTILVIGIFSTFGLGYTSTKFVAELRKNRPMMIRPFVKYATIITLSFCALMSILLFVTADYVADVLLEAAHLSNALRILAVLIIFNGLTTTQIGILAGFGEFKKIAEVNAIVGGIIFVTSVILTYLYGLNGALIALLITQIINWLLNFRLVKKSLVNYSNSTGSDKSLLREVLKFSTPIALQEMTYTITSWLASILLVKYATYSDLGMYNAAMQWNAIILFIPGILRNVVLSHLSENNDNDEKHSGILKKTLLLNFGISFICACCVFVFSGFITRLYGASFKGLGALITIAVFTTVFISVSNVYAQAYMSKGLNWTMFILRFIRDAGILVLAYLMFNYKFVTFSDSMSLIISSLIFNVVFLVFMAILYNIKIKRNYEINQI